MRFRKALHPEAQGLPGAVMLLAEELKRMRQKELTVLYADQERFYLPEFEIAQQEFAMNGIACTVVSEMDAVMDHLASGVFLDMPFLHKRSELYDILISSYENGDVSFVIPPKPFLGAKGVLAFLRNDTHDPQVEALLLSFIRKQSLDLVRSYIPETILVGKQAERAVSVEERISQRRFVLKESISSGMKGTVFSDEDEFQKILSRSQQSKMNWILQEEVINQPQCFSWYEGLNGSDAYLQTSDDWFMRVTVQYVNRQLGDIIVTARRSKAVHGAKDCIQIGTVII